jgi:hypothetical protein
MLRPWRVQLWPYAPLAERAWQLRGNFTIYDAVYVCLAELPGTSVVTLDTRLAAAPGARCPVSPTVLDGCARPKLSYGDLNAGSVDQSVSDGLHPGVFGYGPRLPTALFRQARVERHQAQRAGAGQTRAVSDACGWRALDTSPVYGKSGQVAGGFRPV